MKTGSLTRRVTVAELLLLALILVGVVSAVTLAYRAKLDSDLRGRLYAAGNTIARAGSGDAAKPLVQGLALEGVATHIEPAANPPPVGKGGSVTTPVKPGSTIQTRGSLVTLDQILPDGTEVIFSASGLGVDHAVNDLLFVEALVALVALTVGAFLGPRVTRTALRPLSQVVEISTRIAEGDSALRLRPSRTDTELGSMAAAFDRMVDALESAITEARTSEEATRRFLADASHELRTPIAALQASAETLLREQPARPTRDRLEAALVRDGVRLGRLVDELLGLARLEADFNDRPVQMGPLARATVHDALTRAPAAEIVLSVETDATVQGDAEALARVIRNLLDNAVAAVDGSGRIELSITRVNGTIQVRVTDNGPGVPEPERDRIFERFVRLDNAHPGSGLGLAIARAIARRHNGDLTCDPCKSGASFTLRLPEA